MAGSINGQNHLIPQAEKATSVLASSTEQQERSYRLIQTMLSIWSSDYTELEGLTSNWFYGLCEDTETIFQLRFT